MSRIGKFTVAAILLLPLALGGCPRPKKGTASPEDYFPLIQVALAGGETAAMIARNEFIERKDWGGCVAGEVLIVAFDGANQVLTGRLQDKIVIPAIDLDVSECLALRDATKEEGDESASLKSSMIVAAVVGPEETAEEKPAEEPATEEKPAEESATEEKPAEEPAVSEEAEEAAEEVATALKGNPDAAALVEAIAGITLTAVLHYANKLKTANCKKGTAALGALHYVNGMIKPIADEVAEPDGKISVPATTIDLGECAEG